jgi:hypothetical protein
MAFPVLRNAVTAKWLSRYFYAFGIVYRGGSVLQNNVFFVLFDWFREEAI